jgi:hypothetical protein
MNIMRQMVITVCTRTYDGEETAEYHGTYVSRQNAWDKVKRIAGEHCSYTTLETHPRFTGLIVPINDQPTRYIPGVGFPERNKYEGHYFIIKPVI